MGNEIERRWLLPRMPGDVCRDMPQKMIEQGYWKVFGIQLRLRRIGNVHPVHYLTVKRGRGMSRKEWEVKMPRWLFALLWPKTEGRRLRKIRTYIPYGAHTIELDVFEGALLGLFLLECEFASKHGAQSFTLPLWAAGAIEVTDNPRYTNSSLAKKGIPL